MAKIVHVSSVHPSTDTRVFHKQCVSAASHGYDVTLIARAEQDYASQNVKVRAVKTSHGGRLMRFTRTVATVSRMALAERGDLYHLHDAELLPLAVLLRLLRKAVIYDAHEDLVQQIRSKGWIPGPLRPLTAGVSGLVERLSSALLSAVVVANPLQTSRFPRDRTMAVQNFPLNTEIARLESALQVAKRHQCFYVGGLSTIRGVREMVSAIEIVNRSEPVDLVLGGWFTTSGLEAEVRHMEGWKYVRFLGPLDRESLIEQLSISAIGLTVVHPVPNHQTNQPVKLFEYMMAGIPVIVSDIPNYRQFVVDRQAGIAVDPLDPADIAAAILKLIRNEALAQQMGKNGRLAVVERYNWDSEAVKLLDLYAHLLHTDPGDESTR